MKVSDVVVKTDAATTFNNRSCGELRNGDVVYAIGPKQSDGSIAASRIYFVPPRPPVGNAKAVR